MSSVSVSVSSVSVSVSCSGLVGSSEPNSVSGCRRAGIFRLIWEQCLVRSLSYRKKGQVTSTEFFFLSLRFCFWAELLEGLYWIIYTHTRTISCTCLNYIIVYYCGLYWLVDFKESLIKFVHSKVHPGPLFMVLYAVACWRSSCVVHRVEL